MAVAKTNATPLTRRFAAPATLQMPPDGPGDSEGETASTARPHRSGQDRAVRIAEYRDGYIAQTNQSDDYVAWSADRGIPMLSAIQRTLLGPADGRSDSW
jgi:hypothetical protein